MRYEEKQNHERTKKATLHSFSAPKRGVAATRCRQILANLKGNLSQTIQEEREDRV